MASTTGRDPFRSRIPVTVLTGFLGSGKTTLLNALLKLPEAANTAVIVNEFGDVGIDHELVRNSTEAVTLLDNGCVCCALRGDLQQTLRDLFLARRAGEIDGFERVILETTGLADPAPVMQTLITDAALAASYRLDGVVTVIDAAQGRAQLAEFPEAMKQAAVADRIVISKADLAGARLVDDLAQELAKINPTAQRAVAAAGVIAADFVLGVGLDQARVPPEAVERWLGPAHEPAAAGHAHGISTFTLWFERPFEREVFEHCVEVLTALRGSDLLRVKGLVNVAGESGPVVVQGVQHLFHPPVTLAAWPGADRRSRLVFITRGIARETVAGLFAAVTAIAPPV